MKYVIQFSKTGYMAFISHLDLMRVFKRAFSRAEIKVSYSHGFNPHPKLGFAQPLSLGYEADNEMLEFETETSLVRTDLFGLQNYLPSGIVINACGKIAEGQRSIASSVFAADYKIAIPVSFDEELIEDLVHYLADSEKVLTEKKTKRGDMKEIDIKPGIREVEFSREDDRTIIDCSLDAGSSSNLSPELLINVILAKSGIDIPRNRISVTRKRLHIPVDYKIEIM